MFSPYSGPYTMPPPWGSSPTPHGSRTSRALLNDARSSSPPAEDRELITPADFCTHAGLDQAWASRLEELGFTINSNLDALQREDWLGVGFKPLEWVKVKKAVKRIHKELK